MNRQWLMILSLISLQIQAQDVHSVKMVESFDGVNLFCQDWKVSEPKAVMIIVHGLKDYSSRYEEFALELNKSHISVYACDLRGHGKSDGKPVYVKHFKDYVTDLVTLVGDVTKETRQKPFIFGHSMGGAIVTSYGLANPGTVRGVILSAPALKVTEDTSRIKIFGTKVIGSVLPRLPVFELKNSDFSRKSEMASEMSQDALIHQRPAPARTAKELLKTIAKNHASMDKFDVPFLVLHGDQDRLTNPEGSKELYLRAKTFDRSIKIYPGAWHDLLHEPNSDEVIQDIKKWLLPRLEK